MEMDLNQDAAVKTTGTNILVSASAGAGKTRVLASAKPRRGSLLSTRVNRLAIVLAFGMAAGLAQAARTVKYPAWTGNGADNCFTNTANWNDSAIFTDLDNVPRPLAGEAEFDIDLPDYELYNPALVFAVRQSWGKIVLNGQGHTFSMPAPKQP